MGRINFVRIFVLNFAVMVKPIHNRLKHDQFFSWTKDVERYFVGIKRAIGSTPVLAKPYFDKDFIIYMNSTEEAIHIFLCKMMIKTKNSM
jgi:hypothetical protein